MSSHCRDRNTGIWDAVSIYQTGVISSTFLCYCNHMPTFIIAELQLIYHDCHILSQLQMCGLGRCLDWNFGRAHLLIRFWWTLQPVRLVDPHLVATFHKSYTEADLWVTTELVNTSSKQMTVSVKLDVSLDDVDGFCIVDHVHISQDVIVEGNSSMPYSLPPVIFYIGRFCLRSTIEARNLSVYFHWVTLKF